jgi:DNA-binding NarL/FixJ family response regulator
VFRPLANPIPDAAATIEASALSDLRVLIVDDDEEVRRTVAALLERKAHVIGTAENGQRAIELAALLCPDIVVLDICMPVLDGIAAAVRLRECGYRGKIVFLSMQDDSDFIDAALATGALGYVLKCSLSTDLTTAILLAVDGKRFVSPALCRH